MRRILSRSGIWALALVPVAAGAAGLGEIKLHSHLGEPLRAEVGIIGGDAQSLGTACFNLASRVDSDLPVVSAARVKLVRIGGDYRLLITGTRPIDEPAFVIGVRAGCGIELQRDFVLLPHIAPIPAPVGAAASSRDPMDGAGLQEPAPLAAAPAAGPASGAAKPPVQRRAPNPAATASGAAGDRLVLGMPPVDAPAPKSVAPAKGRDPEMERRIQELEYTLTLLNSEVGKLDQAINLATEVLVAQQKAAAVQAAKPVSTPPAPRTAEPDSSTAVNAYNWIELILSALIGGAMASLIPRFLAKRRERQLARELKPLWSAPVVVKPGTPAAPGAAVFARQQFAAKPMFDDLSFVTESDDRKTITP